MGTLFRSHPDWKMCEIVDYNLIIQRGMVAGAGLGWAGGEGRCRHGDVYIFLISEC